MISILLATYNGDKFFKESLNSVLNQSFNDFEILIGLNGENQNTKKILLDYNDKRIKVFDYHEDKGKAKTLNKLVKESKYDWLAIQDDDDVWVENKLQEQIKYINEFDIIGTQITYINENSSPIGNPILETLDQNIKAKSFQGINQIANTSAIFKKQNTLDINGWKTDLDGIEDFDFWLRLMRNNLNFINLPLFLVNHRIHTNSNFNTKKHDLGLIL